MLALWERHPSYRPLLTDLRDGGGELRRQMTYVQLSFAILIAVFWGGLGPDWRPFIAAAAMIWGFGDDDDDATLVPWWLLAAATAG